VARSTPEGRVKKRLRAFLDSIGAFYSQPIGSGYGSNGDPDFIACVPTSNGPSIFVGIEVKADKTKKPSALQGAKLNHINHSGGIGVVYHKDNADRIEELLRYVTTATPTELQRICDWARKQHYATGRVVRTKKVPTRRR